MATQGSRRHSDVDGTCVSKHSKSELLGSPIKGIVMVRILDDASGCELERFASDGASIVNGT